MGEHIRGNNRSGITRTVSGVIDREGCSDLLDEIKVPVGIGAGDAEPERSERIHAAIGGSEPVMFEGASALA